jgi:hypothetical protein
MWKERLRHPAAALAIGLLSFPLAKLLWIPNYVFNFLTTLVHEVGHSAFAWFMGMPSIPSVSVAGGGMTVWGEQMLLVCAAVFLGLGALAWRFRERKAVLIPLVVLLVLYPVLALTRAKLLLAIAGGVLFEIGGATACFVVVLGVPLERAFERPLYALWEWWMLLNRGAETVLMLRSPGYRQSQAIINSGLAAGMTSDLQRLRESLGLGDEGVLWLVLVLCILALPTALGIACLRRRRVVSHAGNDD